MGNIAARAWTLALLVAAEGAFLWMFLSSDPLEQLAAALRPDSGPAATAALRFAADWRHGMAANSWIYMPGFFVTAAAAWLHARHAPPGIARAERTGALMAALAIAWAGALPGSSLVVRALVDTTAIRFAGAVPAPSLAGAFSGVYTLVTWLAFVLACRAALVRRTLRPFLLPAILTVGLAVLRPWTVDEFTNHWAAGVAAGNRSALTSLALVFVIATLLARSERRGSFSGGSSSEPQPCKAILHDRTAARAEDEQDVSSYRDQVKAG